MASLIRSAQKTLRSSSSIFSPSSPIRGLQGHNRCISLIQSPNPISSFLLQTRFYSTGSVAKSHFEANILRIIRNEIEYQTEYAPPSQPATMFNSFVVQDRPGETWMTMRGRYNDNEDIKLEVTMFDGCATVSKPGDDNSGQDVQLHISVLVDISKGNDNDALEFVCSAWPDCLEIQKVYLFRRDEMLARPYMGPDFRKLNYELRDRLREFLEARGVNDELSVFLHDYMMNKDRIELVQWLGKLKAFVEK